MRSMTNAEKLFHEFMTSRLDYFKALLVGCPARLINFIGSKMQQLEFLTESRSTTILARFCPCQCIL